MQTNTGLASDSSKNDSLALGRSETALQAFEYASWHLASAFARWRRDCLASLVGMELSGSEASILHIIHMGGRPKGLGEISRLLHRDDTANLQYGTKKLLFLGYIEKASAKSSRKLTTYRATTKGDTLINAYLKRRAEILLALAESVSGLAEVVEKTTNVLHVMIGLYDQASDIVTSRTTQDGTDHF
jgi:predicted MarR family transcription regulator